MLRFRSAGSSHPGLVRGGNEDSGFAGPYLQLVADGVGGAAAGEIASATAAYVVSALHLADPTADVLALLARGIRAAHEQLQAGTALDPARSGMGTTLTALLTDGARVALGHVGDSRAYRFRDGQLTRLSRDHTYVQSLVDSGVITADEARRHPRKNVVLEVVTGSRPSLPDLAVVDVVEGDRVLVCSDGLTDLVEDDRIAYLLHEAADPQHVVDALVADALAAGGVDNVTCLVADVVEGPRLQPDGLRLGAFADPYLVVDPAAVREASAE